MRTWKVGFVPIGNEVVPDVGGVGDISQEVGMLLHSRNAKCGALKKTTQDCMMLSFIFIPKRRRAPVLSNGPLRIYLRSCGNGQHIKSHVKLPLPIVRACHSPGVLVDGHSICCVVFILHQNAAIKTMYSLLH